MSPQRRNDRLRMAVCHRHIDPELIDLARQIGLGGYVLALPDLATDPDSGALSLPALRRAREETEARGLSLFGIENVPMSMFTDIVTGGRGRDRQLDAFLGTIENMGAAGIPVLGFYFAPDGVWRTSFDAVGRGGSRVSAFDLKDVARGNRIEGSPNPGRIHADKVWENYQIFLDTALPVAEAAGVRLAHHPDDPPIALVDASARVFGSFDSFRRAREMAKDSESWGLQLCLGTVSEMSSGVDEVQRFISHFGSARKIVYVHMRSVIGTVPNFEESFIDEGNYSVADALQALTEVGFDGWIQDDHVPRVENDTAYGHRARCHAIGYIQGVADALNRNSAR